VNSDRRVLSRTEVRNLDAAAVRELGLCGLLLMENAARGVADVIQREFANVNRITILCGPGNNGGDGLAVCRQLAAVNIAASVFVVTGGKQLSDDAAANLKFLTAASHPPECSEDSAAAITAVQTLTKHDLIVDCLLGTGVRGPVKAPFDQVIEAVNASHATVIAVDVPSGLNCDTGAADGVCVLADRTVTFVGLKQGFLLPIASDFLGQVTVAHIGLPYHWVTEWLNSQRQ
jgi:hydroxyethylthiazole kinase-like uncharacterized protein yjeF